MRTNMYSACAALKAGMDILFREKVTLDSITGHGGFFKVKGVGQRVMAAALGVPVTVMATAGEGSPWGMAVLAAYMEDKREALADFLSDRVFAGTEKSVAEPDPADAAGFAEYMKRYSACLAVERAAVETADF